MPSPFHTPWSTNRPYTHPSATPVWPICPTPRTTFIPVANLELEIPQMMEPGIFPAQPLGTPVPSRSLRLHPCIIYNPINPSIPILQWDILHRPEHARVYTGRQLIVPLDLQAEAVMPEVKEVYIDSDNAMLAYWMKIWGPIIIKKDKIVIRDVLDAIYEYFQEPLKKRDLRKIKEVPGNYDNLLLAAQWRIKDSYDQLPEVAYGVGFKRVDVMGAERRFQGLRSVLFLDNTWKVFLGLLSGPVPRVY